MPAVSREQFKMMFVLYKQGKISKKQLDDFTQGVNYKDLPEHKPMHKMSKAVLED